LKESALPKERIADGSCKKEKMKPSGLIRLFFAGLSSGKLALALVAVLILFSLVGVIFPQKSQFPASEILQWQQQHPSLTTALKSWGLFSVFHSIPFMITIGLLAINTLTCTAIHFAEKSGFRALAGPEAMNTAGFLLLHLSLIVLFAGGFISAATRMDGYILLTEGQSFTDRPQNYLRYATGLFQPSDGPGFSVTLKEVHVKYEKSEYLVDMTTTLLFQSQPNSVTEGIVKINNPTNCNGKTFTLDDTGYSPRLVLRQPGQQRALVNSFVALQTFTSGKVRQYRDYLPLPFLKNRITLEFYPVGNKDIQTGEILTEPLILVKTQDSEGDSAASRLPLGQKTMADGYEFEFAELRQWASFRVSNDPGYPVVWVALWLGLGALLLRYLPELREWTNKTNMTSESG
jgi:cytochrome c biogenesis protein ResB